MSTDILNNTTSSNANVSSVDNNGTSSSSTSSSNNSANNANQPESLSNSSTSSSSAASTSNAASLGLSSQLQTSTSMMGAPTSVVVTVSTQQQQQQQQHTQQQGPSTSSQSTSSSSSQLVAGPSSYVGNIMNETTPGTSSTSMQYLTETANYLHSMISQSQSQTSSHHLMHSIQSSSSSTASIPSSSSSSGSHSLATGGSVVSQTVHHLIKRPFESNMDNKLLAPDGSCAGQSSSLSSKRSKMSSSSISPPPSKLFDTEGLTIRQKLEQRLNGILCCAVCLDLPRSSVYQCTNGHLMCAGCFTHVLADARLRDESPTCPSCRVSISKESCSRNLAVEKAVSELPGECRFCQRELPRSMLEKHMTEICEERIVPCTFSNIGCPWNGPFHEATYHANDCNHPNKLAREVLPHLENEERRRREQRRVHETLFTLLSYEKIAFHDIQFRPYRTDEYIHKLFYETSRFSAFNLQWVVKARVNDDQRDPTQSCQRHLSFQLCLKSKINNAMTIHYMLLKGPYGETKVLPMIYKFDFNESQMESNYNCINLSSTNADSNRLLAARMINFRLIMFQASK